MTHPTKQAAADRLAQAVRELAKTWASSIPEFAKMKEALEAYEAASATAPSAAQADWMQQAAQEIYGDPVFLEAGFDDIVGRWVEIIAKYAPKPAAVKPSADEVTALELIDYMEDWKSTVLSWRIVVAEMRENLAKLEAERAEKEKS